MSIIQEIRISKSKNFHQTPNFAFIKINLYYEDGKTEKFAEMAR